MSERISREELVKIYNVEVTFFDELVDSGLLHYDLEINLPGLEVIHDMLQKMEDLKQRNRELMSKLSAIGDKYQDE